MLLSSGRDNIITVFVAGAVRGFVGRPNIKPPRSGRVGVVKSDTITEFAPEPFGSIIRNTSSVYGRR